MFFRPETSLIPSVLALSDFFISSFPHVSWYPYWYLGDPFSYLIGPVVPVVLLVLSRALPFLDLYYLYLLVIIFSIFLGGIGIYRIARGVVGIAAGVLYVILPFSWLGLYFQNGLKNVAFALLPFVFVVYRKFLVKEGVSAYWLLLVLLITVSLLTTINVLLALIVGVILLFMAPPLPKAAAGEGRAKKVVQTVVIFGIALSIATFWYTPQFWWVLLTNPSFGGVPLWNLTVNLFQSALNFLPMLVAILVVKWRTKARDGVLFFGFLFFLSFLFLTAARFLADPDFVTDWIGFLPELQFGAAILLGSLTARLHRLKYLRYFGYLVFVFFTVLSISLLYNLFFYSKSDYKRYITDVLSSHVEGKEARVFLSGTDVFWINSYLPLQQVRGGNDGGSIHPNWSHGAYQIREGERSGLMEAWSKILGSSYILVHQDNSSDPFHDFKHAEKFKSLELLVDKNGERLYRIPGVSLARVADLELLRLGRPKNGADAAALEAYVNTFLRGASMQYKSGDVLLVRAGVKSGEVVSLAVSYDPSWKIVEGRGKIMRDSIGNMVIVASAGKPSKDFVLRYERSVGAWFVPLILVTLGIVFLLRFGDIYPRIKAKMPKLHLGLGEEEG